ncbi:MAG: oxalate/formate MFS antiporter [Acidobacteria bacterium]|nr:MAG: oxalate/formate MFS antiporter [Acidobacteriota bacterium]
MATERAEAPKRAAGSPERPWFQLGLALGAMIMIANLQYAWTLFVEPLRASTGWSLKEVQWGFSLFILLETWTMPLEGWLIDRLGPRLLVTVAGALCAFGWSMMSRASSLSELYLYYGIAGVGAAIVYGGSIASAVKWFPRRRGLAAGIIAAGFGAGSAPLIPLIARMIATRGYRATFLWSGIIQGAVIVAVAQFMAHPPRAALDAAKPPAGAGALRQSRRDFTTAEMLRTPHFWLLYVTFVFMATGGLLLTAQAGPVAREWGLSLTALTVALTFDRISNGAGRIFWGFVSDRIGRERAMTIAFTLHGAAVLSVLLLGRRSGTLFTATVVLALFTWGEIFSLFPSITTDLFGARHATSNYSFMYSAKGVAGIVAGGLAARIFEAARSWSAVFYGSAVLALLAAVLSQSVRRLPLPTPGGAGDVLR